MSDIRANTISDTSGNGPINLKGQSAAKVWCNFNGGNVTAPNDMTGVRNSFNISGIVDNGTGSYTANFSQNMESMNYSASITTGHSTDMNITNRACCVSTTTAGSVSASIYQASSGSRIDMDSNSFIIHGDLA